MNVNPIVIATLASLSLPVTPNVNLTGATEYITFNYMDERPTLIADDTDLYDTTVIQVHYFTKGNPQQKKKISAACSAQAALLSTTLWSFTKRTPS